MFHQNVRRAIWSAAYVLMPLCLTALAQQTEPPFVLTEMANPVRAGSISANLTATHDDQLILSWLEPQGNGVFALKFALQEGIVWSKSQTVIAQREFVRYPAELPTVTRLADGSFVALWAQNKPRTREGEDVYFSQSRGGKRWTKPQRAHTDNSLAEHGLVSLVATTGKSAALVWLDGREEKAHGRSMLMQRSLDSGGNLNAETVLDDDVCSCCPTAMIRAGGDFVLAYRDRTKENIRDIAVLRYTGGRWSVPKALSFDGWHLEGCPTNSVDLAADGERVAAAWFTAANDAPKIKVAFSQNAGATFGEAMVLNEGATLGRASLAVIGDDALVTWVEQDKKGAKAMLRRIGFDGRKSVAVMIASGGVKSLGFPRIRKLKSQAALVWGDTSIHTAIVGLK